MRIELLIPGLIWPNPGARSPSTGLPLPGLERLLGQGQVARLGRVAQEAWLSEAFGLPAGRLPLARLRRAGEDALPPPDDHAHYLCADPVNLHFAREHLLLTPLPGDALGLAEARTLAATLEDFFKPLDANILGFEVAGPERWYLKLANAPRTAFFPLDDVTGRPVSHFLPEGEDCREWQRLVNEVQVLLHNHPLNQAREAAGERPVNSVWLWGDGDTLPPSQRLPNQVLTQDLVTRGLARTLGVPLGAADALPQADALVVIDTLLKPSLALDLDAWRGALTTLETQWFAPLASALKTRRCSALRLLAPGDRASLELRLSAGDFWKFWRRPATLESCLPQATMPENMHTQGPAPR